MYAIRSYYEGDLVQVAVGSQHIRDGLYRHGGHKGDLDYRVTVGYQEDWGLRITSYNVCYTKLLRNPLPFSRNPTSTPPFFAT